MFGSQVLEVMVGLLLIYLALSVACSGIKEVIGSFFELRSKTLEAAIRNMLHDDSGELTQKLFANPVIAGTAPPGEKPSYISARNFAVALFEVVAVPDGGAGGQVAAGPPAAPSPRTFQDFRASIANLPNAKLRKTLLGLVDSSQGNIEAAQKKVENWFDDTMQRVSGWYKRTAQKLIFCVGFVLCLALNADTFVITKELWADQALRSAVVAQASQRVEQPLAVNAAANPSPGEPAPNLQTVAAEIREAQSLPIGWGRDGQGFKATLAQWPGAPLKLLGLLVTSFAILMGAPFWFDLLNNVMNLRLTGRPPDQPQT